MNFRDVIGAGLMVAFISALAILFWKAIPTENEQLIVYMLGQLSGFVAGVVSFHYVTKSGEKELEATRAENTGKAFEAISAAAAAAPPSDPNNPQSVIVTNQPDDPVPTVEAKK